MTIRYEGVNATFEGVVTVEEAEALARWFAATPGGKIDLTKCEHLHAAVLQLLLRRRPLAAVPPADPVLAALLEACMTNPLESHKEVST